MPPCPPHSVVQNGHQPVSAWQVVLGTACGSPGVAGEAATLRGNREEN